MRHRLAFFLFLFAAWGFACGWDPSRPFERNAPEVDKAIAALDAGEAGAAAETLEQYLSTGACTEGNIGTPDLLKRRPNGTIDLGLSLFSIGESFGRKFGEEEVDAGWLPTDKPERATRVQCALRVVHAIADDDAQPKDVRARAYYLEGNLHFLNGDYRDAVASYDRALALAPGREAPPDGGKDDPMAALGRDAAYNRAIALRRIKDEQRDAGSDGGGDGGSDGGGKDGGADSGSDGGADGGGGSGNDGGNDAGADAAQSDSGTQPPPPQKDERDAAPPPPKMDQDDLILQQLEKAPTVQQEAARRAGRQRIRGMQDK